MTRVTNPDRVFEMQERNEIKEAYAGAEEAQLREEFEQLSKSIKQKTEQLVKIEDRDKQNTIQQAIQTEEARLELLGTEINSRDKLSTADFD